MANRNDLVKIEAFKKAAGEVKAEELKIATNVEAFGKALETYVRACGGDIANAGAAADDAFSEALLVWLATNIEAL